MLYYLLLIWIQQDAEENKWDQNGVSNKEIEENCIIRNLTIFSLHKILLER